jgi:hypothetical protein
MNAADKQMERESKLAERTRKDYLKWQYAALRDEHIENKKREFYCLGMHGIIIPAILRFGFWSGDGGGYMNLVLYFLPFVTVGASVLFTAAWTANFRIGKFIKEQYEAHSFREEIENAKELDEAGRSKSGLFLPAWEQWLELGAEHDKKGQNRIADNVFFYGSYLSFGVYYAFLVVYALNACGNACASGGQTHMLWYVLLAFYAAVGFATPIINYMVFRPVRPIEMGG